MPISKNLKILFNKLRKLKKSRYNKIAIVTNYKKSFRDLPKDIIDYIGLFLCPSYICITHIFQQDFWTDSVIDQQIYTYYKYILANNRMYYDVNLLFDKFKCVSICGTYNIKFNMLDTNKCISLRLPIMCNLIPALKIVDIRNIKHLIMLLFMYYYLIKYIDIDENMNIIKTKYPECSIANKISVIVKNIKNNNTQENKNYLKQYTNFSLEIIDTILTYGRINIQNYICNIKLYPFVRDEIYHEYSLYDTDGFKHRFQKQLSNLSGNIRCDHQKYDITKLSDCNDAISIYNAVIDNMQNKKNMIKYIKILCDTGEFITVNAFQNHTIFKRLLDPRKIALAIDNIIQLELNNETLCKLLDNDPSEILTYVLKL